MINTECITALEAQLTDLRARISHDDEDRRQPSSATDQLVPALDKWQQQVEQIFARTLTTSGTRRKWRIAAGEAAAEMRHPGNRSEAARAEFNNKPRRSRASDDQHARLALER